MGEDEKRAIGYLATVGRSNSQIRDIFAALGHGISLPTIARYVKDYGPKEGTIKRGGNYRMNDTIANLKGHYNDSKVVGALIANYYGEEHNPQGDGYDPRTDEKDSVKKDSSLGNEKLSLGTDDQSVEKKDSGDDNNFLYQEPSDINFGTAPMPTLRHVDDSPKKFGEPGYNGVGLDEFDPGHNNVDSHMIEDTMKELYDELQHYSEHPDPAAAEYMEGTGLEVLKSILDVAKGIVARNKLDEKFR